MNKHESGYFIFDAAGAVVVIMSMVIALGYVNIQLSYMDDLEARVSAATLAREQLDKLCIERKNEDLISKKVSLNGHEFSVSSVKENGSIEGITCFRVNVAWQGSKKLQHIVLQKEIADDE